MAKIVLTGRITELIGTRRWGPQARYMVQVAMEREPTSKVPVGERYYCNSFYVGEEEVSGFQPGRPVRITLEQD